MKNRIMIIAALILGAASVAAVASCLPDEPVSGTDTPAVADPDVSTTDNDGFTVVDGSAGDVMFVCGPNARAAEDFNPDQGYWYYCEQALVHPDEPDVTAPGGAVDPASIAAALGTACPTEDSENCFWDASRNGNGQGASFVTVEGHIFPLDDIYAGH